MMDFEKKIEEEIIFYENRIRECSKKLNNNGFNAHYAQNKEEALMTCKELIEGFLHEGKGVIGIADSKTLHQINLFDWLYSDINSNYTVYNTFERCEDGRFIDFKDEPNDWIPKERYIKLQRSTWEKSRKALLSEVFLTGANAITMDGHIISTDGAGNRIAGVIFGPLHVILVVGRNKIVENNQEALNRIKNIATPINHLRHSLKHGIKGEREKDYGTYKFRNLPCVKVGHCVDCGAPLCTRHCTMVLERATGGIYSPNRIHVIIVNEDLGL